MATEPTEDEKHTICLRSPDPRTQQRQYAPRMRMLDDDPVSLVERGTHLEEFVDWDEARDRQQKRSRRRRVF